MRKFIAQNRNFLIIATVITVLSLLKVHNAHASDISRFEQLPSRQDTFLSTSLYSLRQTLTGQYAYSSYLYAPAIDLADGGKYSLQGKFRPANNWVDTELMFATRVVDSNRARVDFLWGASTGQESKNLYVQPSARLGVFAAFAPRDDLILTAKITGVVAGGKTIERPCIASYGADLGEYAVKCSMASSVLSPQETLKYLQNTPSKEQILAKVEMKYFF